MRRTILQMILRSLVICTALVGCTMSGTLDNVPGQSPASVTNVRPGGPESQGRPECPANPPSTSCPVLTRYDCQTDDKGCRICTCATR